MAVIKNWLGPATLILAALCLPQTNAWADACFEEGQTGPSFRQSIDDASSIVLAKVVGGQQHLWSPKGVIDFSFEVEEALKGSSTDPFSLRGRLIDGKEVEDRGALNDHQDIAFWDRMATRLSSARSCEQVQKFELGGTYLIIDPSVNHLKTPMTVAYELITDPERDIWLQSVRTLIANEDQQFARAMPAADYLRQHKSVVLIVVDHCVEKLRGQAFHLAQVSEPLVGEAVTKDDLDPALFATALEGCDGITAVLGMFYRSDTIGLDPIDVTRKPMQRFIPITNGEIDFSTVQTEIDLTPPTIMSLDDLVAELRQLDKCPQECGEAP